MERIPQESLDNIRYQMMQSIIRKKALTNWRLFDRWYLIGVDGTGYVDFKKEHCNKCLRRELKDGSTYYYHPVLEAKLVTGNGLALSIGSEFIENIPGKDVQDCELMAFYRWAKKFKRKHPQLSICLLLDGLYACRPVFKLCERYGWKYIITFKEGSMSDVYNWYETVRDRLFQQNYKEIVFKDTVQQYRWVSPFEHYNEVDVFHIFECKEKQKNKEKKFVWITNIPVTKDNVDKLANQGGRLRWKIENEGFNSQKKGGYELEHAYSHHPLAMKNFYLLLQIAHIINQLVEKGSLLKNRLKHELGSIRNIAHQLLEDLKYIPVDSVILAEKIQIRLDSS